MNKKKEYNYEKYPFYQATKLFYALVKISVITTSIFILLDYAKYFILVCLKWYAEKDLLGHCMYWLSNVFNFEFSSKGFVWLAPQYVPKTEKLMQNFYWYKSLTVKVGSYHPIKTMCLITVLIIILLLFMLLLRHHYGEQQPFKDDMFSRRIKDDFIDAFELRKSFIKTLFENKEEKNIHEVDKKVNEVIENVSVEIHTKMDMRDKRVYRTFKVKLEQPKVLEVRSRLLQRVNGVEKILTNSIKGAAIFSEYQIDSVRENFVFIAVHEVEGKVAWRFKRNLNRQKSRNKNNNHVDVYEYTFPLDLMAVDKQNINNQEEKARIYAEEKKKIIDGFIINKNLPLKLEAMDVGKTSIQYIYLISQASKNVGSLLNEEQDLSAEVNSDRLRLSISGNKFIINLSLPEGSEVPIDIENMFETAFGKWDGRK